MQAWIWRNGLRVNSFEIWGSPSVTSWEHGVNQPDNSNNKSNSFPIIRTLADEPDEGDELLDEREATKERRGRIRDFVNKARP